MKKARHLRVLFLCLVSCVFRVKYRRCNMEYKQDCLCVRVACVLLRLPYQVVATALVFLHQTHAKDVGQYIEDGKVPV